MPLTVDALNELDFLRQTWTFEDGCEQATDAAIPTMGVKVPQAMQLIGRALAFLDPISSCSWNCSGGDHAIERLVFRSCNRARAAVRLLRLGFYDECLMLARANGETANLLWLFHKDPSAVGDWKGGARRTTSPVEVRRALEAFGDPMLPPVDRERYKLLSGVGAHSDPDVVPAAHNVLERPITPGHVQPEGVVLCVNEIALPLAFIGIATLTQITVPAEIRAAARDVFIDLFAAVGGLDIKARSDYWAQQRDALRGALESGEAQTDSAGAGTKGESLGGHPVG